MGGRHHLAILTKTNMQAFSRRGFQLRSASLETRLAYTGFLLMTLLGVVTLLALSVGRVGFVPEKIAIYYRGGESEMSFPKTFWQLMEVSHFHLFTVPVVVLILSHLLYATPVSTSWRVRLTLATYGGALLEALGPWSVRYLSASCAWGLLLGWGLLAGGSCVIVVISLVSMWGPKSWIDRAPRSPLPSQDEP
jgi:hypothetical protein